MISANKAKSLIWENLIKEGRPEKGIIELWNKTHEERLSEIDIAISAGINSKMLVGILCEKFIADQCIPLESLIRLKNESTLLIPDYIFSSLAVGSDRREHVCVKLLLALGVSSETVLQFIEEKCPHVLDKRMKYILKALSETDKKPTPATLALISLFELYVPLESFGMNRHVNDLTFLSNQNLSIEDKMINIIYLTLEKPNVLFTEKSGKIEFVFEDPQVISILTDIEKYEDWLAQEKLDECNQKLGKRTKPLTMNNQYLMYVCMRSILCSQHEEAKQKMVAWLSENNAHFIQWFIEDGETYSDIFDSKQRWVKAVWSLLHSSNSRVVTQVLSLLNQTQYNFANYLSLSFQRREYSNNNLHRTVLATVLKNPVKDDEFKNALNAIEIIPIYQHVYEFMKDGTNPKRLLEHLKDIVTKHPEDADESFTIMKSVGLTDEIIAKLILTMCVKTNEVMLSHLKNLKSKSTWPMISIFSDMLWKYDILNAYLITAIFELGGELTDIINEKNKPTSMTYEDGKALFQHIKKYDAWAKASRETQDLVLMSAPPEVVKNEMLKNAKAYQNVKVGSFYHILGNEFSAIIQNEGKTYDISLYEQLAKKLFDRYIDGGGDFERLMVGILNDYLEAYLSHPFSYQGAELLLDLTNSISFPLAMRCLDKIDLKSAANHITTGMLERWESLSNLPSDRYPKKEVDEVKKIFAKIKKRLENHTLNVQSADSYGLFLKYFNYYSFLRHIDFNSNASKEWYRDNPVHARDMIKWIYQSKLPRFMEVIKYFKNNDEKSYFTNIIKETIEHGLLVDKIKSFVKEGVDKTHKVWSDMAIMIVEASRKNNKSFSREEIEANHKKIVDALLEVYVSTPFTHHFAIFLHEYAHFCKSDIFLDSLKTICLKNKVNSGFAVHLLKITSDRYKALNAPKYSMLMPNLVLEDIHTNEYSGHFCSLYIFHSLRHQGEFQDNYLSPQIIPVLENNDFVLKLVMGIILKSCPNELNTFVENVIKFKAYNGLRENSFWCHVHDRFVGNPAQRDMLSAEEKQTIENEMALILSDEADNDQYTDEMSTLMGKALWSYVKPNSLAETQADFVEILKKHAKTQDAASLPISFVDKNSNVTACLNILESDASITSFELGRLLIFIAKIRPDWLVVSRQDSIISRMIRNPCFGSFPDSFDHHLLMGIMSSKQTIKVQLPFEFISWLSNKLNDLKKEFSAKIHQMMWNAFKNGETTLEKLFYETLIVRAESHDKLFKFINSNPIEECVVFDQKIEVLAKESILSLEGQMKLAYSAVLVAWRKNMWLIFAWNSNNCESANEVLREHVNMVLRSPDGSDYLNALPIKESSCVQIVREILLELMQNEQINIDIITKSSSSVKKVIANVLVAFDSDYVSYTRFNHVLSELEQTLNDIYRVKKHCEDVLVPKGLVHSPSEQVAIYVTPERWKNASFDVQFNMFKMGDAADWTEEQLFMILTDKNFIKEIRDMNQAGIFDKLRETYPKLSSYLDTLEYGEETFIEFRAGATFEEYEEMDNGLYFMHHSPYQLFKQPDIRDFDRSPQDHVIDRFHRTMGLK